MRGMETGPCSSLASPAFPRVLMEEELGCGTQRGRIKILFDVYQKIAAVVASRDCKYRRKKKRSCTQQMFTGIFFLAMTLEDRLL